MSSFDDTALDQASLHAEAHARAGGALHDFGEDGYRERLAALLAMYDGPARLSRGGRKATRRRLVQLLENRLHIHAALVRHPEIHTRRLRRPVYLTGLPRTGTSMLFNVLAADPRARALLYWEGCYPNPSPTPTDGGEDPRLIALRASLARAAERNPDMAKIHQVSADGPEECVQLLAHTLGGVQNGIEPMIAPYREHFFAQDLRPVYAYYADLLRLLDWQRPGERWLLKSPAHLWGLDLLVGELPDACIVQTHRDPRAILGSYCSMMRALMSIRESVDARELGPLVLEYLARSVERAMDARAAADPRCFIDISYADLVAHPLASVRAIYAAFDLELAPASAAALERHVHAHPQNRHGTHDYALAEFGLTASAVLDRMARYVERFDLPTG
jgi:hypothetical protein